MGKNRFFLIILAVLIAGSFWGCGTKVYTNTGTSFNEVYPPKRMRMKVRIMNYSTYHISVYIPQHGKFELSPSQKSVIFELYPDEYTFKVTYYRENKGRWGGVEHGTSKMFFYIDATKENAMLDGEVLDATMEIEDWDIRRR